MWQMTILEFKQIMKYLITTSNEHAMNHNCIGLDHVINMFACKGHIYESYCYISR